MNYLKSAFLFLQLATAPLWALDDSFVATDLRDPMEIAVAPDGDVFIVEREGRLLRVHPSTGAVHVIGRLPVTALRETDKASTWARECGLLGLALAPDFATSRQLFLYYSHESKMQNNVSRFTLKDGLLDLASEVVLLSVPTDRRDNSTHMAGSLMFGSDGYLYLSTGDNTNPFESGGYAPIDDRDGREHANAMRASGNTNDLRGKILRVKPTATGSEIPSGNLFPPGTPKTRPEIFVMGCRNPFRISMDPKSHTLYWGEVGPDADKASAKGPAGHDEINQAKTAGNYGWPFVVADNKPYPIVDFATGKPGAMTDPAAPKNPSKFNTGLVDLPPARPAFVWYPYAASAEFPLMGSGGRNAMAGPVFYYDAERKYNLLTAADDHTLITYDWMRNKAWKVKLDENERFVKMEPFIDGLMHPIDMDIAPDGALYVLEYGSEWYFNKNGRLRRIIPGEKNGAPTVSIKETGAGTYEAAPVEGAAIQWFETVGNTDEKIGDGPRITFNRQDARELRAISTGKDGRNTIARRTFDSTALPLLTLKLTGNPATAGNGSNLAYEIEGAPDAAKIVVRARYIATTGHDSGGPQFPEDIRKLLVARQCLACHQIDIPSVGPRYLDVAMRYREDKSAADTLRRKLKTGGSGVWGEIPMPPQAAISDEEAARAVGGILALAGGVTEKRGEAKGTIVLPSAPANAAAGGSWEIIAEAPGTTAAKVRIAAE